MLDRIARARRRRGQIPAVAHREWARQSFDPAAQLSAVGCRFEPACLPRRGRQCDHERVVHVMRLVTFVEVTDSVADPRRLSVSARHEAVLSNGDRVILLDDRGWSESGPPDIWSSLSAGEIVESARVVVGPDEPFDGYSQEYMQATHWATLAEVLRRHDVDLEGKTLSELPHEVELGEELLTRLRAGAG